MKKLVCLALMMFALILSACAKASPQAAEGMINPGDKVGDFLITTGEGKDVLYPFDYSDSCADKGDKVTFACAARDLRFRIAYSKTKETSKLVVIQMTYS